ncbi:glycosyltransferase [uncultured Psychroserpens sp.]|uniref:glycosyltransferase n=1 Tax=uncultured Psychroserpens sp. TaxID=255436 RepID=UPI00260928EE|nr:glycosyltransferase [uncultured Psychroserpens sp.]
MKVIHYIGSLAFGGIERLVYDLVSQQTKQEVIEVSIGVGCLNGEFKTQFESLDATLINLNLKSGYDLNPSKILKISKQFKLFDVIHLHAFHLSIVLAALLSGKKIVYTEHGNFGFGRTIKTSDKISFFLRKLFFKTTGVNIYCNSNFTKRYVESHFYGGKRLHLLYNGSALNYSIHRNLLADLKRKYENKYVIGTSSRLAGFKRIDRLITVFSTYVKTNPSSVLVIVGEGVERQNLEQQVSNLNLENHVVFEGFQQEVATYQSVFDVCVFSSTNEPFGLVAVECFSKKKPVLVFEDGGGITEIVDKFQPKDICKDTQAMISRLDYYKEHDFAWSQHHDEQLTFFSLERMEKEYYNAYCK